tara:strand:- start:133 stop:2079 length:1947 start_codon:yes stop_codon:yes gene_type:complete
LKKLNKSLDQAIELHKKGYAEEALSLYLNMLSEKNKNSKLLFHIGNAYLQTKRFDLAIEYYKKTISTDQNHFKAYNNLGGTLSTLGRYEEAIEIYKKTLKINPDFSDAYSNLGSCYHNLNQYEDSIFNYNKAIKLNPNNFSAHNNLGSAYKEINQNENAISSYNKAIQINPDYYIAYNNLGNLFQEIKLFENAVENYRKVIELKPDYKYVIGKLMHARMRISDWQNYEEHLDKLIYSLKKNNKTINPFPFLSLIDNPGYHKINAEIYAKDKFIGPKKKQIKNKIIKNKKIKLGYFSPDFRNHPIFHLIKEIFQFHNKSKFEIYAFSFGPKDNDNSLEEVKSFFTKFIDIRNMSDKEVANLSQEIGIDIAIDLCGYTAWNRANIFYLRAAPIQINYLGYPGTMGADFIDYIIADKTVIPENEKINYSEKVVYLPNCYQPNTKIYNLTKKKFVRVNFNLPEDGIIFCNFNSSYKITPNIFNIWINILKNTPKSVLWLLKSNNAASENIWITAEKEGIDRSRIIFTDRLPHDEHLKRIALADIFLDTFPYNAHTTASDTIRMGVPIIALMGKSFASRVSASILNQVNMPELITTNTENFQNLAINIATNKKKLKKIKDDLKNSLSNSPLFDSVRFTKDLETLYQKILDEKN